MTTLYGECIYGSTHAQVRIDDLRSETCELLKTQPIPAGLELALWIGAIGPFVITTRRAGRRRLTAHFKQPLDAAILAHFKAR